MNSTNYLTPTVQIASPCYLIKKKKKKKERNTKYIYIYISKTAERAMKQQKYFFHRMKKRKKKKKYPLWKCPSTWHHRHIAIFFSRFTAPLFAFYRATLLPTLTYMCLVVANEICARKKTRVWERETWLDEQRKKNWNRKFSSRKTTSIPRKGMFVSSEEEYPQYTRVMTDNYFEGFGTKEGSWRGRGRIRRRRKACKPRKW